VFKKEAENILQYEDVTVETHPMWNVKTESDTRNKWGKWNFLKIIQ
jgi:hypothetical protein